LLIDYNEGRFLVFVDLPTALIFRAFSPWLVVCSVLLSLFAFITTHLFIC